MPNQQGLFPGDPGYVQTPTPQYTEQQSATEIASNFASGQPTSQQYFQSISPTAQNTFTQTLNQQGYQNPFSVSPPAITSNTDFTQANDPSSQSSLSNLVNQYQQGFSQDEPFLQQMSGLYGNLAQLGADLGQEEDLQAPDAVGQYNALQGQYGVQGLQDSLTGLQTQQTNAQQALDATQAQIQKLQTQFGNYAQDLEGQGGFENIVGGRQNRLNKELSRLLQPLQQAEFNQINNLNRVNQQIQNQQATIENTKQDILQQIQLGQQNFENLQSIQTTRYGRKKDQYGIMKDLVDGIQKTLEKQTELAAKNEIDPLELIRTLVQVPEGVSFTLPDGTVVTGLKSESPDITTLSETDAQGNVTAIGINKTTGELVYKQNLGQIGKPQSSGTEQDPNRILSISEAKALGVPFGTTAGDAYGISPAEEDQVLSPSEAEKLGVPYGTTEKEAAELGITPRTSAEPKEFQSKAATYAQRIATSAAIIDTVGSKFTGVKSFLGQLLPNFAKTSDRQSFEQAQRDFVNAVLRRESGAAIADSEFKSAQKQYFPQPGDNEQVVKQKATNRLNTLRGIILESGSAWYQLTGTKTYDDYLFKQKAQQEGHNPQEIQKFLDQKYKVSFSPDLGTSVNGQIGKINIPKSSRLAYVNNNPGNLRFVGQKGATQGEGGFARFSSPEAGYKALQAQIKLDASRGHTLQSFINKYAPPSENNTSQYLSQISQKLGLKPNTKISTIDLNKLASLIAQKESSTKIG